MEERVGSRKTDSPLAAAVVVVLRKTLLPNQHLHVVVFYGVLDGRIIVLVDALVTVLHGVVALSLRKPKDDKQRSS